MSIEFDPISLKGIEPDPAVVAHAQGDHETALTFRLKRLHEEADRRRPEYAGYLAASALNCEREGQHDEAVRRANDALQLRTYDGESEENQQIRMEQLPSVRINAGAVLLRSAARLRATDPYATITESRHQHADNLLALAMDGIRAQRTSRFRPHQHAVNVLPRLAMSEAVNGNSRRALKYALGSLAVAPLSESPLFVEHTSGLSWRGRALAKAKSIARSVSAVGTALTTLPGLRERKAVQRIRDRIILAPRAGA